MIPKPRASGTPGEILPEKVLAPLDTTQGAPKTQPCPECGSAMVFEVRADEVTYLAHTRALETLGWWCSKCGEAILEGAALRATEKAYLELKADVDERTAILDELTAEAQKLKLGY